MHEHIGVSVVHRHCRFDLTWIVAQLHGSSIDFPWFQEGLAWFWYGLGMVYPLVVLGTVWAWFIRQRQV